MEISQPLTAVSRNGEKSAKFTFFFRNKNYLSGKYAVSKFATSASRNPLTVIFAHETAKKKI
jgi:hypothetical protein